MGRRRALSSRALLLVPGLALVGSGCGEPELDGLAPDAGAPHALVEPVSENEIFSSVWWDAGDPAETQLPGGFLGGGPFSVPHAAGLGDHPVQLRRRGDVSAVHDFTVTDPALAPFPAPRLEYLNLCCYEEPTPGTARFLLLAQGADVDVGADVLVDGVAQETVLWRALRYDDGGIDPTTLAYPVYHYALLVREVEAAIGASLDISLRNDGGATSNVLPFTVPDAANIDSDGDGLLDDWEINGYDADGDGTIDVDLPGLGATPFHKDLFVEVDFMTGKVPAGDPWTLVEQAFAAAPVLNLDGPGIRLHIDRGQSTFTDSNGNTVTIPVAERDGGTLLPHSDFIRMDENSSPFADPGDTTVGFFTLKSDAANFDPARLEVFHYGIIADQHGHSAGASGRGEIWGNDFFVTLRDTRLAVPAFVAGTFMHEFGHTLNLRHGGGDDGDNTSREPNHVSVMSYFSSDGSFVGSYQVGGVDVDCDSVGDGVYDYSRGRLADLDETSLDENVGLCDGAAIDWNDNGSFQTDVSFDISGNAATVLDDFNSWGRLYPNFRAAGSGWNGN